MSVVLPVLVVLTLSLLVVVNNITTSPALGHLPPGDDHLFVEFAAEKEPVFAGDPAICSGLCPVYTTVDVRPGYEVRSYPSSLWVSTFVLGDNRVLAELEGWARLKQYLDGNNDQGVFLNTTVPLVTQIKYRNNPGVWKEARDYTMALYLSPSSPQTPTPYPMTSEVLIDSVEQRLVFVRNFRAHIWEMTDRHVRSRVGRLVSLLQDSGEAFLSKYFYLASYSRPDLYNESDYELWLFASRFRDSSQLHPRVKSVDPPLNKVTLKTMKRVCRGLECPRFDVLRGYKYGIQKRRYYDTKLASYSPDECEFSRTGLWRGFMPLHLYKHGVNSHLEILEATRPIGIVQVKRNGLHSTESNRVQCAYNYTVSFYLPERFHSNPPTTGPQGPRIRITSVDDLIVYVHTVGGYILDPDRIREELGRFTGRLRQFGLCYQDDEYYVVVYDFVVRFHGRLNEIWLIAKTCERETSPANETSTNLSQ